MTFAIRALFADQLDHIIAISDFKNAVGTVSGKHA